MDIDFRRRILYLRCSYIQNLVESRNSPSSKDHVNATLHFRHCFRPKCQIAGLTCKNCSSGTWFQIAIVTTIYWWMSTNREWKTGSYNDIQVSYWTLCCCQFFFIHAIFFFIFQGVGSKPTYEISWYQITINHYKSYIVCINLATFCVFYFRMFSRTTQVS